MSEIPAIQSKQHENKGKDKLKYKITWKGGPQYPMLIKRQKHPDTKAT